MLLAVSAGKVIQRPAGSRPRPLRRPCCSRTLRSPVRPQRGPEPLAWEVPQRIWTRAEGGSQGIGVHSLPPAQWLRVKTEPASDSRFSCGWRWARGCCSLSPSPPATAPTGGGVGPLSIQLPVAGRHPGAPESGSGKGEPRTCVLNTHPQVILGPLRPGAPAPAHSSPRNRMERRLCSLGVLYPGREGSPK